LVLLDLLEKLVSEVQLGHLVRLDLEVKLELVDLLDLKDLLDPLAQLDQEDKMGQ